jgi:hypothetical protein
MFITRNLNVLTYTFLFCSKNCHHSSGGAAVDLAPSQEDPYVSPCKYLKLIACLVQRYSFSSNLCTIVVVGLL